MSKKLKLKLTHEEQFKELLKKVPLDVVIHVILPFYLVVVSDKDYNRPPNFDKLMEHQTQFNYDSCDLLYGIVLVEGIYKLRLIFKTLCYDIKHAQNVLVPRVVNNLIIKSLPGTSVLKFFRLKSLKFDLNRQSANFFKTRMKMFKSLKRLEIIVISEYDMEDIAKFFMFRELVSSLEKLRITIHKYILHDVDGFSRIFLTWLLLFQNLKKISIHSPLFNFTSKSLSDEQNEKENIQKLFSNFTEITISSVNMFYDLLQMDNPNLKKLNYPTTIPQKFGRFENLEDLYVTSDLEYFLSNYKKLKTIIINVDFPPIRNFIEKKITKTYTNIKNIILIETPQYPDYAFQKKIKTNYKEIIQKIFPEANIY